jgi:hypothetical protein
MTTQWHFNPRRPCDRARDPKNDAFFTAESLENLSEALIREGIQNSLDAAKRDAHGREVRIRIAHVSDPAPEARQELNTLFSPAKTHFEKGLLNGSYAETLAATSYLVFEDFGTKGLTGNVAEWQLDKAGENAFFNFFRAEGRSGKSGESLGRWGIGKHVFPTASRLASMFGVTVRSDKPTEVLMGSAIVRTHSIGDQDFQPDAWFGCRDNPDSQVMPVTDPQYIQRFKRIFGITRNGETGLSVLVPCLDDRVTMDDLRRGIVRNFFWPILLGELVVELQGGGASWHIDAESIPTHRALLPSPEAAVVEFALWASTAKPLEIVELDKAAATKPDWRAIGTNLLSESMLKEIRELLELNQKVGVRIPVRVRPKAKSPDGVQPAESMSYFTVFIGACRDAGHRPIFLRDGIVIKDIRAPQMQGNRSLVVVDDPALAGLLGDSEGVNHTQWQKDSPKFHNRYIYGPDTIKFVTRSVYEIMQALHAGETKGDPTLLLHLFYVPTDEGKTEPETKPKDGKGPATSAGPKDLPPSVPRKFELKQVDGGFVMKPGKKPMENLPIRVRIEAAYGIRRGNPMKRWAEDDFAFTRLPLRQEPKPNGVIVTREDGNSIELEIRKPEFEFGVCGFDKKRDLVVRAIEVKEHNEEDI